MLYAVRAQDSPEVAQSTEELHSTSVAAGRLVWVNFLAKSECAKHFKISKLTIC
jgi:hypothetical protein